jgi:hypothetical protein
MLTLGTSQRGNVPGLSSHVVDDGRLQPRNLSEGEKIRMRFCKREAKDAYHKVGSFGVDRRHDTIQPRVLDCSMTTVDCTQYQYMTGKNRQNQTYR